MSLVTINHEDTFELNRKKNLGQYFSGGKLSRLLAAFSVSYRKNISIIDPMCGIGDMLLSARLFNKSAKLYGIEIDQKVHSVAEKVLSNKLQGNYRLINGNAFSPDVIKNLPLQEFDLVITNPPYVRYQTLSDNDGDVPNAREIRNSLLEIINILDHIEENDKEIFKEIVRGYSGLSDLAVPSWILCSLLTKEDGKLAMVVPESWLNRNYSYPIQYLLLKFFEIEYVIEDVDRCWFSDAQIKTNLIIAKRRPKVVNLLEHYQFKSYSHIAIKKDHGNDNSLVGRLIESKDNLDEILFKSKLEKSKESFLKTGLCSEKSLYENAINVISNSKNENWFILIESNFNYVSKNKLTFTPPILKGLIEDVNFNFVKLEDIGVNVGQGLRTGANKFFYVDIIKDEGEFSLVKVNSIFKNKVIKVPSDYLIPVLRKQAEISSGFTIDLKNIEGRVLVLNNAIHPKDYNNVKGLKVDRRVMNTDLANFISEAEVKNVGSESNPKYIPYLSAVKTNARGMKGNDPNTISYWYMLPQLVSRHTPELFVPRVNNNSPRFFINTDPPLVIDANFSTLWLSSKANLDKYALLALLNSSLIQLLCEHTGTVMGGGALKLEATHLKKFRVPLLTNCQYEQLSKFGLELCQGKEDVLEEINYFISKALSPNNGYNLMIKIDELLSSKRNDRAKP